LALPRDRFFVRCPVQYTGGERRRDGTPALKGQRGARSFMSKRRQQPRDASYGAQARPGDMTDAPSQRVQAAHRLWNQGRRSDAMALFSEAIRQEPNNVRPYVMAARAYAEGYDFARMDDVHERLIRRAPSHPGVHHYVGETYSLLKLPQRALASFRTAANLPDGGPPTWMELASLCERAHQLDEAQELIERTVRSGFDMPLVGLVRGRIQRRQNRLEEAEASFRTLIERYGADSEWVAQAWSELALMADAAGDYAGAIDAIGRCKHIQRLRERPYLEASDRVHEVMRTMIDAITRDDFRRWREEAAELPPARTALLTGFPRSGTTLLEQVLDAHPDLVSSEERDFVGSELVHAIVGERRNAPLLELLNDFPLEKAAHERQRYLRAMEYLLGEPIGSRMHLDKNPAYNLTIPAMLRVFPETRLIVALRDPRDVVLSCYLRYLPLNAVSVRFLDVQRTAERYALDMQAWLKFRELVETPWVQVRYEDTVADVATQARRALETLDLAWDERVLGYRDRLAGDKRVTSPSYEAVAKPIYTGAIGRWRNYAEALEPALEVLAPFVREFGYVDQ
jgi:tetratricopeptide (TPR) repeat protein